MNNIQLFLLLEKQKEAQCNKCNGLCWINNSHQGSNHVVENWNTVLPLLGNHKLKYLSLLKGACVKYASKGKN